MRKLRRLQLQTTSKNLKGTKAECGPNTLIYAFEQVLEAANKSKLQKEKLETVQSYFDFIEEKLSINSVQAIIIAMMIDYNNVLDLERMSNFLNIRNIRMLTYMNEIEDLVNRGIVRCQQTPINNTNGYAIHPEVFKSYMQNKAYTPPTNRNISLKRFMEVVSDLLSECESQNMDYATMNSEISELIKRNQRHSLCKKIKSISQINQVFFLICCIKYIQEGDRNICEFQYNSYFNRHELRPLTNSLVFGNNPLFHENLIVHGGHNGMGNKESVGISDEICEYLNAELNISWETPEPNHKEGLKLHEEITEKELFYNPKEQKSIAQLNQLLQPQQFQEIQKRLTENGMRKGFACIFYGVPGTGKTETVLQLAKDTGRDIMEVNIANIKSKWVGETEKNIKNIFSRYRKYCKRCEQTPILLFNEADALINKRTENVTHSVDKMENAMQNIILEEMENLEGILIATTNLTSNMDKAFERRFLYKVEFNKPEESVRTNIWQSMIKGLSLEDASQLAREFDFSGGQIENIARKQMVNHILYGKELSLEEIRQDCLSEILQTSSSHKPIVGFRNL